VKVIEVEGARESYWRQGYRPGSAGADGRFVEKQDGPQVNIARRDRNQNGEAIGKLARKAELAAVDAD
jgi:hypothetical protein